MDVKMDLLSEPLVAEVAGEGPLLVVHQTLVLVQHRLYREETDFSYQHLYRINLFIRRKELTYEDLTCVSVSFS